MNDRRGGREEKRWIRRRRRWGEKVWREEGRKDGGREGRTLKVSNLGEIKSTQFGAMRGTILHHSV